MADWNFWSNFISEASLVRSVPNVHLLSASSRLKTYCGRIENHENADVNNLARSLISSKVSRFIPASMSNPRIKSENLTSRANGCVLFNQLRLGVEGRELT